MSLTAITKPDSSAKTSAGAPTPAEEPAKGGGKKKILILVVLLLVIGGAAYWFVLKPTPDTGPKAGKVVALDTTAALINAYFWNRSATSSWSRSTWINVCSRCMIASTRTDRGDRRMVDNLQVPTG